MAVVLLYRDTSVVHCCHIIFRMQCFALVFCQPASPTITTESNSMLPPQAPTSH